MCNWHARCAAMSRYQQCSRLAVIVLVILCKKSLISKEAALPYNQPRAPPTSQQVA